MLKIEQIKLPPGHGPEALRNEAARLLRIRPGDICSLELDGFMYGLAGNPGTGNDAASGGQEGNNPSSSTPSGEAGNGNTKAKN